MRTASYSPQTALTECNQALVLPLGYVVEEYYRYPEQLLEIMSVQHALMMALDALNDYGVPEEELEINVEYMAHVIDRTIDHMYGESEIHEELIAFQFKAITEMTYNLIELLRPLNVLHLLDDYCFTVADYMSGDVAVIYITKLD